MKRLALSVSLSLAALPIVLALGGCSANFGTISPTAAQVPIGTIKGSAFGGQQPIVGSDVYLFAVGTSTFDGSSVSLLSNTGHTDSFGRSYVVTDSDGEFNISGDYTCTYSPTAPQVLYLYLLNGDAGAGNNSAAGLLAVLGTCPSSGTFANSLPYVYMNEVSTVAAAFSLRGYASDATDISEGGAGGSTNLAPTVLANQGLMNAAANANQLYQVNGAGSPMHAANTTTPGSTSRNVGTVPAALINSIANSLAACVNSAPPPGGGLSSQCATLFGALPVGPSGTEPTDTASAAIYIARNPANNVATIFGLGGSNPVFTPTLAAPPYDFTVAITYTAPSMVNPLDVAIDAVGNAWVSSPSTNTLTELSSTGVATNTYDETNPNYIDIDTAGNGASSVGPGDVFAASVYSFTAGTKTKVRCDTGDSTTGSDCIDEVDATGVEDVPSHTTGNYLLEGTFDVVSDGTYNYFADVGNTRVVVTSLASPAVGESFNNTLYNTPTTNGGAFDYLAVTAPSGYLWATSPSTGYICRTLANVKNSKCTGLAVAAPEKIAIDSSTNAWIPDSATNTLYHVLDTNPSSISLSPAGGYTGGGLNTPFGVAIDGNGTVWTTNTGPTTFGSGGPTCTGCSISAFYSNGAGAITPATVGTAGTSYYNPNGGYTSGNQSGDVGYANLAVDGSGDIWITNSGESSVTEIIGVASPTVTPLSYAVASGSLAQKP
jgi:hypothetical protein